MNDTSASTDRPLRAVIIGAGPAGLTAAMEFLDRTDYEPIVLEGSDAIGGISRTVNYKGNRIDIGGHRFFSKSDRVMNWWLRILPLASSGARDDSELAYQGSRRDVPVSEDLDPETQDELMLLRHRMSRIYYGRKFYNYPVTLDATTIRNLGLPTMARIGFSYLLAKLRPRVENNLEDFYVNRFGHHLYTVFFRDYTEKVWGVPCAEIAADWGAQRVRGLSVMKTLTHAIRNLVPLPARFDLRQKNTETSLIESFLYPKYGPGQLWESVARIVEAEGGSVELGWKVTDIHVEDQRVVAVTVIDGDGSSRRVEADVVISTMAIKDLVAALRGIDVPPGAAEVAAALPYRDFMTVGVLARRLVVPPGSSAGANGLPPDNWIYIQEPDVRVGRLQVFNNWSPYMVTDPNTVWVGMEYFTNVGDDLWSLSDDQMAAFGVSELEKIGLLDSREVLDTTVLRVEKTYPAYFGAYSRFDEVRSFLDGIDNLYLVGRNGQHRYNNQDHSMLTAMTAVENIAEGRTDKTNIWAVNVDQDYHEVASGTTARQGRRPLRANTAR